jgi:hypothetical protein
MPTLYLFLSIGLCLPTWFIWKIWIRQDTRAMYVDAAKTIVSACAVAASLVSLVVSARGSNQPGLIIAVRCAVVSLVIGLVASMITIFALSRSYDRAVSRWYEDPARKGSTTEQGKLSRAELLWVLIPAWLGIVGFLEGFIFVVRIAFVI